MEKNRIVLKKKERIFIDNRFYIILKGSILAYDIFQNGKYLPKGGKFKEGDIIGNFFSLKINNLSLPEVSVEGVALEDDTILEEFKFNPEVFFSSTGVEKILFQLIKENLFKLFYQLYDKKRYILSVLRFYTDKSGKLSKEYVRFENFAISKSQFYSLLTELKKDKFILEKDNELFLNLKKVEKYLLMNED